MTHVAETAEIVPPVVEDINKPIFCSLVGFVDASDGVRHLERRGIPEDAFPESAVSRILLGLSER
jgi:hypothetical protein